MVKKGNKKLIGIALIVAGLLLAFMPSVFPSGFLASIATQSTSAGELVNGYVTPVMPFEIKLWTSSSTESNHSECWRFFVGGERIATLARAKPQSNQPKTGQSTFLISYDVLKRFSPSALIKIDMADAYGSCGNIWNNNSAFTTIDTGIKVWIDGEGCQLTENEMVVAETFASGRTISKADLRFPVKGFCNNLPILVLQEGLVVEQKVDEYLLLNTGFITIPVGQTWTVFYIANVDPSVAVVCQDGVYDAERSECVVSPAIVFSCSGDSIFDPVQQLCISQPETRIVCELQDAVYNTATGKCVKIIPVDATNVVCPANSTAIIDAEGNIVRCEFVSQAVEKWVCEAGHLDTSTDPPTCLRNADTSLTQIELIASKAGFDLSIGMILGIVLAMAGLVVIIRA